MLTALVNAICLSLASESQALFDNLTLNTCRFETIDRTYTYLALRKRIRILCCPSAYSIDLTNNPLSTSTLAE